MKLWWMPLLVALAFGQARKGPPAPTQPIAFSHKQHSSQGLQCKGCHGNPDPGEIMGLPAAAICMGCHQTIKKDSPQIERLSNFARQNRPVPWVRVYQIPSYVWFSHRAHREAGAICETCHGRVAERDALWREGDITMGGCMSCHEKHNASNDCTYCHEAR